MGWAVYTEILNKVISDEKLADGFVNYLNDNSFSLHLYYIEIYLSSWAMHISSL